MEDEAEGSLEAEDLDFWQSLPTELYVAIFAPLSRRGLLAVSLVCKRWYAASCADELWKFDHEVKGEPYRGWRAHWVDHGQAKRWLKAMEEGAFVTLKQGPSHKCVVVGPDGVIYSGTDEGVLKHTVIHRPKSETAGTGFNSGVQAIAGVREFTLRSSSLKHGHWRNCGGVSCLDVNNNHLAMGASDAHIRVVDLNRKARIEGQAILSASGKSQVTSVSVRFARGGETIFASSQDTVKMWSLEGLKEINSFKAGEQGCKVESIAPSTDGNMVVCGGKPHLLKLWDTRTNKCTQVLDHNCGPYRSLQFTLGNTTLMLPVQNSALGAVDMRVPSKLAYIIRLGLVGENCGLHFDETIRGIGFSGSSISLIDTRKQKAHRIPEVANAPINDIHFNPQLPMLIAASHVRTIAETRLSVFVPHPEKIVGGKCVIA